jgi:hypothetical protein
VATPPRNAMIGFICMPSYITVRKGTTARKAADCYMCRKTTLSTAKHQDGFYVQLLTKSKKECKQ